MKLKPQNKRTGIMLALTNTKAAIDLASIMVGIIVIGIIGGVIAATVFAVIPWAQDNAAKNTLDNVNTAQSAYAGFSAEKGSKVFANLEELANPGANAPGAQGKKLFDAPEEGVGIYAPASQNCYLALAKSDSGNIYYITDKQPKPRKYEAGSSNPNTCDLGTGPATSLTDSVENLNDGQSGMPAATNCHAPVQLPASHPGNFDPALADAYFNAGPCDRFVVTTAGGSLTANLSPWEENPGIDIHSTFTIAGNHSVTGADPAAQYRCIYAYPNDDLWVEWSSLGESTTSGTYSDSTGTISCNPSQEDWPLTMIVVQVQSGGYWATVWEPAGESPPIQ